MLEGKTTCGGLILRLSGPFYVTVLNCDTVDIANLGLSFVVLDTRKIMTLLPLAFGMGPGICK